MDGQGTKWRRNIAENFNRLSRAHERYRQTDRRRTDGRWHISNLNVRSRLLNTQRFDFKMVNTAGLGLGGGSITSCSQYSETVRLQYVQYYLGTYTQVRIMH